MQRDQNKSWYGSGMHRLQSLHKHASLRLSKTAPFFFLALLLGAFVSVRWFDRTTMLNTAATTPTVVVVATENNLLGLAPNIVPQTPRIQPELHSPSLPPNQQTASAAIIPFTCPTANLTTIHVCQQSVSPLPPPAPGTTLLPAPACPDYFRWIHEDLRPWKATGITREMVERARRTANFRIVILNGRAYVERYRRSFQTRDLFTLWGILQLLRRYPGRVPDLDLMFDCVDWPVIKASDYQRRRGTNVSVLAPPPLFRYCGDDSTLDVVFPDWSFWGWPEISIKPWERLMREMNEGNGRVKWMDREPYAYWKGNPAVAATRQDLLRCNVSDAHDWNARLYAQDWIGEIRNGFKQSDLASQCIHRYKIYIEGSAWSVSEKYILACDSLALVVKPRYYDFFTRGLMPVHHYWPIREDDKCRSIKFAVDWGNTHKQKAQAIGREASSFIEEKLKMDDVYDYMFHLLTEYSKLLRYKPTRPPKAIEWCSESMACPANGLEKTFMMDSMVTTPHTRGPCTLPPPYSPVELRVLQNRKANSIKQVETWEQRAWNNKKRRF